jgi:hypothetical protein
LNPGSDCERDLSQIDPASSEQIPDHSGGQVFSLA